MSFDPQKHHRRSIRLKGYDYSLSGGYFITLVVYQRACILGEVVDGAMTLSPFGQIVRDAWAWLESQYPTVQLDEFFIMPNHLHGILLIGDKPERDEINSGRGGHPLRVRQGRANRPDGKSLGGLIGAFKTVSTKQVNLLRNTPGVPLWQRNYYEHIIWDEAGLFNARAYIRANPLQ